MGGHERSWRKEKEKMIETYFNKKFLVKINEWMNKEGKKMSLSLAIDRQRQARAE